MTTALILKILLSLLWNTLGYFFIQKKLLLLAAFRFGLRTSKSKWILAKVKASRKSHRIFMLVLIAVLLISKIPFYSYEFILLMPIFILFYLAVIWQLTRFQIRRTLKRFEMEWSLWQEVGYDGEPTLEQLQRRVNGTA